MPEREEETTTCKILVDDEDQYSIWPADRDEPAGWHDAGVAGRTSECPSSIENAWTDMRPRSLRRQMEAMESNPSTPD